MNEHNFKKHVLLVIGIFGLAIICGIALKILDPSKNAPLYSTFMDLVPLIIAIPATWLGYCFQQRQAYLKDVRELWSHMVSAIQDSFQFTHSESPTQSDYGKVLKNLSTVTDELRAVFKNINEDDEQVGYYPFESIKYIHKEISALGFGEKFNSNEAAKARKKISGYWKELRRHYLAELERGEPSNVDSPYIRSAGD